MQHWYKQLEQELYSRKQQGLARTLQALPTGVDFCTNDYLGIAKNNLIHHWLTKNIIHNITHGNGASRLLGGDTAFIQDVEKTIAKFHDAEAALLFPSGYMANYAVITTLATKDDTIVYDKLVHASLRDGIRAALAKSIAFEHNNVQDLQKKIQSITAGNIYIVTETVFSMDGDIAVLPEIVAIANTYNAILIIDEAHSMGLYGNKGQGLIHQYNMQQQIPVQIVTYGKAAGVHGAAIVGSRLLIDYMINFCRPFIYSTSISNMQAAAILAAYHILPTLQVEREALQQHIQYFNTQVTYGTQTAIQQIIIAGNNEVTAKAEMLKANGIAVLPVRYPTVPKGSERIRVVLHSYNTKTEIDNLLSLIA
jgi:8-amino-7-oxononanoate synthase